MDFVELFIHHLQIGINHHGFTGLSFFTCPHLGVGFLDFIVQPHIVVVAKHIVIGLRVFQ